MLITHVTHCSHCIIPILSCLEYYSHRLIALDNLQIYYICIYLFGKRLSTLIHIYDLQTINE